MKQIPMPAVMDGEKFATRYGITRDQFYSDGARLFFPDSLPDAPIIDTPDAPPANPKPTAAITALRAGTATAADVRDVLRFLVLRDGTK